MLLNRYFSATTLAHLTDLVDGFKYILTNPQTTNATNVAMLLDSYIKRKCLIENGLLKNIQCRTLIISGSESQILSETENGIYIYII